MNTANLLTALRIALILPFLVLIDSGRYGLALGTFFLASITDFFDGFVARRFAQQTRLGRFLDPLADKLLISCAYIAMAIPRPGLPSIPVWLAAAVVGRDIMILAGSLIIYLGTRFRDFKPSIVSKVNTFGELGLIVYFLFVNATDLLSPLRTLQSVCYGIVAVTVVASGVDYAIKGAVILREHRQIR